MYIDKEAFKPIYRVLSDESDEDAELSATAWRFVHSLIQYVQTNRFVLLKKKIIRFVLQLFYDTHLIACSRVKYLTFWNILSHPSFPPGFAAFCLVKKSVMSPGKNFGPQSFFSMLVLFRNVGQSEGDASLFYKWFCFSHILSCGSQILKWLSPN